MSDNEDMTVDDDNCGSYPGYEEQKPHVGLIIYVLAEVVYCAANQISLNRNTL